MCRSPPKQEQKVSSSFLQQQSNRAKEQGIDINWDQLHDRMIPLMDKEQGIRFTNPHQQSKSAVWDIERNWAQQQGKTAQYGKEQGVTYPP